VFPIATKHAYKRVKERSEDTKDVIRISKLYKDKQNNSQRKKGKKENLRYTKHYTEKKRSSNTNATKKENKYNKTYNDRRYFNTMK
jgi:hypothetical protein